MTILITNTQGRPFVLTDTHLQAVTDDTWTVRRSVLRTSVARIFLARPKEVQVRTRRESKVEIHTAWANKDFVKIGCQVFSKESLKKIRKWALAKKSRKKN